MNTPQGMKPFNLQEWQNGAKPICRNGFEPTDLHYFEKANKHQRIIFTHEGMVVCCSDTGNYVVDRSQTFPFDLFLKSEKKEGWAVIHFNRVGETEEDAKMIMRTNFNTEDCIIAKIEWYD